MSAIADGIDFVLGLMQGQGPKPTAVDSSGLQSATALCYGAFVFGWLVVWVRHSSQDFSAILTASACLQCLGFAILNLKVRATKQASGMSSRALELFVVFFAARLTSTLLKNGYIPVDKSGDFIYQMFDVCSLVFTLNLLYVLHKTYCHSYQDEYDNFPIHNVITPCAVMAYFFHASVNHHEFFDVVWAFSLYVETFVLVPQLWMSARLGGTVDSFTAHFVACIVLSRLCAFIFWWYGHEELAAFEANGSHLPGRLIVGSYGLQLVIAGDFVYYYVKAMVRGTAMVLPDRAGELTL